MKREHLVSQMGLFLDNFPHTHTLHRLYKEYCTIYWNNTYKF